MRLLIPYLALFLLLIQLEYLLLLHHALFEIELEFMGQPFLTHHDTLLINDVIELAIVFFKNFIFIIFLFFIFLHVLVPTVKACVVVVLLLILVI